MEHATFGVMACILRIEALGQFLEPIIDLFQKYWIWLKRPFFRRSELLVNCFQTSIDVVVIGLAQVFHNLANLMGKEIDLQCQLIDCLFRQTRSFA